MRKRPAALTFATAALAIEIDRRTAAFTYRDSQGDAPDPRTDARAAKRSSQSMCSSRSSMRPPRPKAGENVDGVRIDARNVRQVVDRQAYHTKLEFEWADGEALYGLGSHEEGMFNLRGQHQYLYQQNMKAVVPVLVSTRGYGVFLDSCSLMTFHDDAFGSYLWTDVDDELDYYFIYRARVRPDRATSCAA